MATAPLDLTEAWEIPAEPEPGFSETELVAALQREFDAADSEYERLRVFQELAQKFYEAKPFGNEVPGRSQIILPDVQETIDYMVPSVLRTFVSGDRVVEFEATDEADEQATDDATAAIGYNFMRQQDGYRTLHDWLTCGLMERYGVIKTMVTTEERVTRERIAVQDPVELEGLEAHIEDVEEGDEGLIVTLKHERREKRFIDVAVPAWEFRFSPLARHEDDADYLAHCAPKTRSDLVDMGFDRDQVYSLPSYSRFPDERDRETSWAQADSTPALEEVLLCEEYARIDLDGDGIAERIKVFRVDNDILRWAVPFANGGQLAIETVDEQPFSVFCPFPRPHRLVGWSLADKVMDIQLGRSTIARQLMDGMNFANMPRPIVDTANMDENTLDDLLSPIAGSPIRARGGAGSIQPFQTAFDAAKSLNVMEWFTGERESRTGITRLNQGLDADALNKTATGTAMMQAQGQQQEEFIARNLAEAFSRLMAKKYRLMRSEGEPFKIKVDGQYKLIDPRTWPEDVNVNIRVGLGTGSKDKRIQARMMLAPILAEGFQNKQVTPKHLFHAVDGLVRDLGIGQGDDYWVDPDAPPEIDPATGQPKQPEPDPPSPEVIKAQSDAAATQQKAQLAQQESAQRINLQAQESDARMTIAHQEGQQKIALSAADAEQKQRLAESKATFEANLAQQTADRNYELAVMQETNRHALAMKSADHGHALAMEQAKKVPQERPGGALDA